MLPVVGSLGLLGVGLAAFGGGKLVESKAREFVPQIPDTGGVLGSFAIAGPAGAVVTLAKNYLMPSSGGSTSGSTAANGVW